MMRKSGILALVAVLLVAVLVFAACSPATPAAESSAWLTMLPRHLPAKHPRLPLTAEKN